MVVPTAAAGDREECDKDETPSLGKGTHVVLGYIIKG
jgi:hypothetical protein